MSFTDVIGLLLLVLVIVLGAKLRGYKKKFKDFSSAEDAVDLKKKELLLLEGAANEAVARTGNAERELADLVKQKDAALENIERLESNVRDKIKEDSDLLLQLEKSKELAGGLIRKIDSQKEQSRVLLVNANELAERKSQLEQEMSRLIALSQREATLAADVQNMDDLSERMKRKNIEAKIQLDALMEKLDLYSRIDEFSCVGHFDTPDYIYSTSERYQAEIKEVRNSQRKMIREKTAVVYPDDLLLCADPSMNKRVLSGQIQLMLSAFNIDCDFLIGKVNPANFARTLEQIDNKAEALEKACATMKCGFNVEYIELKFEECKLQYEFSIKQQEEQDEQRLIRERMREEVRVQRQYEEVAREAEKEELKFMRLLEKARQHLTHENEQERALSAAKIQLLEEQLREAHERGVRAKSMAEQTRRGFVYVISNIGSFGESVYKIGLTRRLDPQERVDELGDASVPFQFDVHAMCYSEDAPALETALHRRFAHRRVNAVNLRKEFFRVSLHEIQEAIEQMVGDEVEFVTTSKAREYFESKRLLSSEKNVIEQIT